MVGTPQDMIRSAALRAGGEGSSRNSHKDYLHFLYIARGSLHETHYFVHLAGRLEYIDADMKERLTAQAEEVSRTLTGLIKAVEKEVGLVGRSIAKLSSLLARRSHEGRSLGLQSNPQAVCIHQPGRKVNS